MQVKIDTKYSVDELLSALDVLIEVGVVEPTARAAHEQFIVDSQACHDPLNFLNINHLLRPSLDNYIHMIFDDFKQAQRIGGEKVDEFTENFLCKFLKARGCSQLILADEC